MLKDFGHPAQTAPHIALFIPSFGDGGVERDFVNLANGLSAAGYRVSLIRKRLNEVFVDQIQPGVRQMLFKCRTERGLARELLDFLRREKPAVLMTSQLRDDRIAMTVKRQMTGKGPRFILRVPTPLSERERTSRRAWFFRWLEKRALKRRFSLCDGIVAVSRGVAEDLERFLEIPGDRIAVAPNPAVTPDLLRRGAESPAHPWLDDAAIPVILGVGRLARVKDFPTLLRAFARLRETRPCRLMILGQGRQRPRLEALIRELGIADAVQLVGFVDNPYAYLSRARVLVVSSLREGGPNVLIEAMALGIPAISTDCLGGPREILADGRYGTLVPVGDPAAMAQALAATLDHPLPAPDMLRAAAERYSVENSTRAYLRAFGLA